MAFAKFKPFINADKRYYISSAACYTIALAAEKKPWIRTPRMNELWGVQIDGQNFVIDMKEMTACMVDYAHQFIKNPEGEICWYPICAD